MIIVDKHIMSIDGVRNWILAIWSIPFFLLSGVATVLAVRQSEKYEHKDQ